MRRLNFGCGPVTPAGWDNFDVDDHGQEHVGDIRDGLPFKDGTFTYCVSHHAMQMLPWAALVPALAEMQRVTMKGGWLRISVPDLLAAVRAYDIEDRDHFQITDDYEASLDGKLCMYISQAGSTRSVFTGLWLAELCARAGWIGVRRTGFTVTASPWLDITSLDTRRDESLFIEAVAR